MYLIFCVLQSDEASFFISLSFFHSVNKKPIDLDSSLMCQDLGQNFKMSFTDFWTNLLQSTVLELNTPVIFNEYQLGVLKTVENHIYSIVPTS